MDWVLEIVREVVREHGLKLRMAVIYTDLDKEYLKTLLRQNRILPTWMFGSVNLAEFSIEFCGQERPERSLDEL